MSSSSLMRRVFPPSKPPDGGNPPSFRLIVGGTELRGRWYLPAIVRPQGFSSCRPQGFSSCRPRWRMRRVGGLPPRGSAALFFPQRLGENGILQFRGDFLQPCRDRWAPPRGSAALFFPQRLGENGILQFRGDFLQPCRDRWAAVTRPGRSTTPSVRTTVALRPARAAPTLWPVLTRAKTCRRASRRRQPEMASLPMRLPTPPVALGLRLPA